VLDPKTATAVDRYAAEIRGLLGEDLLSVALYGSAADDDFVPGTSDINTIIVLTTVTFSHLQRLSERLPAWRRGGFATPLIIDREFLSGATDAFPIELHEIQERHRLLWGADPFERLTIDDRHLRYLAEHETRDRLLKLRAAFVEHAGDKRRLRPLLLESLKTFLMVMRRLLRLRGMQVPPGLVAALERFEAATTQRFPAFHALLGVRSGSPWPSEPIDETFRRYLEDVNRLVPLIDSASA
jgi:predicted nucleotidyltransferase